VDAVVGAVAHFQRAMMMTSTRRPRPCGMRRSTPRSGFPRRLQSAHLPRYEGRRRPGAYLVGPARHEWTVTTNVGDDGT
jgi:hypothetical protein